MRISLLRKASTEKQKAFGVYTEHCLFAFILNHFLVNLTTRHFPELSQTHYLRLKEEAGAVSAWKASGDESMQTQLLPHCNRKRQAERHILALSDKFNTQQLKSQTTLLPLILHPK